MVFITWWFAVDTKIAKTPVFFFFFENEEVSTILGVHIGWGRGWGGDLNITFGW